MKRSCRRSRAWLCLIFAAGLHDARAMQASPATQATTARDQLFREVFGHDPPPVPIDSHVEVILDGTRRQKMRAAWNADGSDVRVEEHALRALLAPLLRADLLQQLSRQSDGQGFVPRTSLEQAGITVSFNPQTFEYRLNLDAASRAPTTIFLNPPPALASGPDATRPGPLSGFLNYHVKGLRREVDRNGRSRNSDEAGLALDGALNLGGVVLEGSSFASLGRENRWQRGDLRLVRDFPDHAVRLNAGDLSYPLLGYQHFMAAGGIGVTKDYALQPQVSTYWSGAFTFRLDVPAEVRIYRNDALISTLQLPAGVHDLRRVAPSVGQNDIDVVIDDSAGRREVLHFSFIHDPALLDRGLSLYSWNLGFARDPFTAAHRYDAGAPMLSGSYQRGVTESLTLGGYVQAESQRGLFGIQLLRAMRFGTLTVDSAVDRSRDDRPGAAARLGVTVNAGWRRPEMALAVEHLTRHFDVDDAGSPALRAITSVQASLALALRGGLSGRLNASYAPSRLPGRDSQHEVAATLYQRWGRHVTASLGLRHRQLQRRGEGEGLEVLFGLRATLSNDSGSYQLTRVPENGAVHAQWNSVRSSGVSTPYGRALVRTAPQRREYAGVAGYRGTQGLIEGELARSQSTGGSAREIRNDASLRLQGSLGFVNRTVAMGPTITENFAIVTGQEGLQGVALRVDPGSRSHSRARAPAADDVLVADLASYRRRDIRVEPVDPPPGATPANLSFQLAPTYKSGVLLKVGLPAQAAAFGRLVDDQGMPLPYLTFEARRLDDPEGPALTAFTGRAGTFQLSGLKPGRYLIRSIDPRWQASQIDIRVDAEGLQRLGDVVLPR